MKISANNIKAGNTIFHNNRACMILKTRRVNPGKRGAYIHIEMKDIQTSVRISHRFRSNEYIKKIILYQKTCNFLYQDNSIIALMNQDTFEQENIDKKKFTDTQLLFLQTGMKVLLEGYENILISVHIPSTTSIKVKKCEPAIKKQTINASYKPATLVNGVKIMVPNFINQNDEIEIDIKELKYLERVSKS